MVSTCRQAVRVLVSLSVGRMSLTFLYLGLYFYFTAPFYAAKVHGPSHCVRHVKSIINVAYAIHMQHSINTILRGASQTALRVITVSEHARETRSSLPPLSTIHTTCTSTSPYTAPRQYVPVPIGHRDGNAFAAVPHCSFLDNRCLPDRVKSIRLPISPET